MQHRTSADFWQEYSALPEEIRRRADKQFALLQANPQHPSLQFKKIGEREGHEVWSARVTLSYRALAIKREWLSLVLDRGPLYVRSVDLLRDRSGLKPAAE